ncbi:MAG: hypothetical protein K2X27_11060 [Candidatus Obscuribacterales bacterium]|nr:hypothetical protein [Candidatus Obscuribacterales bacterium]
MTKPTTTFPADKVTPFQKTFSKFIQTLKTSRHYFRGVKIMYYSTLWTQLIAKWPAVCKICKVSIKAHEAMWWSWRRGVKCGPCYHGKDPARRKLTPEARTRIAYCKERLSLLDQLPKPFKPLQRQEYSKLLSELGNYKQIKEVREFLTRLSGDSQSDFSN